MLFAKANFNQLNTLINALDLFCRELGQMISKVNATLVYSSNVPERLNRLFASRVGFSLGSKSWKILVSPYYS